MWPHGEQHRVAAVCSGSTAATAAAAGWVVAGLAEKERSCRAAGGAHCRGTGHAVMQLATRASCGA